MNDHSAFSSRSKTTVSRSRRRRWLAALLSLSLLTEAGCGIPCLRCAKPGPAMPANYNWNNGISYPDRMLQATEAAKDQEAYSPSTTPGSGQPNSPADQVPTPEDAQGDDSGSGTSSRKPKAFDGLIRAASFLKINRKAPQDVDTPPEDAKAQSEVSLEPSTDTLQPLPMATPSVDLPDGAAGGLNLDTTSEEVDIGGVVQFDSLPSENSAQLPQNIFYSDPFLFDLIQQALSGNQELRILNEEIQIARNETYARSGEYRPFLSLGGSAGLEKSGRHTREGAVEEQLEVAPGQEFPDPLPDFMVATNISWELDIWKRLRNAQRAAAMRYLGTQEGRNYIVTRLVADIAENYYQLLSLDARLQNLERTIQIQQQSLAFAEAMKQAGRGTELAVQRFEAEVQKNQSERSLIVQEIVEVENRINFLVGRYPQPIVRTNLDFLDLNLSTLSAGVPSQLLQNRADIRQAEREVQAAGLDVQVARARFYPNLTLTGGLGWNAFSTGYLFRTPESLIYGVAGELVGPLINKRAIQAAYSSANAAQLQAIYDYQRTILEAHIEVVNQISRVENYARSIENKKQQLSALEASVDSASKLFQNARAEYVEVLLAQREMMEARMILIDVKREQLSAIVNAYQALGGGGFQ